MREVEADDSGGKVGGNKKERAVLQLFFGKAHLTALRPTEGKVW